MVVTARWQPRAGLPRWYAELLIGIARRRVLYEELRLEIEELHIVGEKREDERSSV